MSKIAIKRSHKTLLSIAVSILFIVYVYLNRHSLIHIFNGLSLRFIPIIFISQVGVQFANSGIFYISVNGLGQSRIGRFESFKVTLISSFVNFFTPTIGGASTKAVYLKKKHLISYPAFIAVIYASYLISFLVSFLFGLTGIILSGKAFHSGASIILILSFTGGIFASLLLMLLDHKAVYVLSNRKFKKNFLNKIIHKLILATESWIRLKKNKNILIRMSLYTITATIITVFIYILVMKSLNINITIWAAMLFAALSNISLLFNITPGNIGIRETIYASTFFLTAISAQQIVAFSLLERALLTIMLGLGWALFSADVLNKDKVQN